MGTIEIQEIGAVLMGLIGGLALFLFGMDQMTEALRIVAGGGMKRLLARLTTNRFKAATAGAFVTAVVQSSSVTTVLVVGFISAGLMTLPQSIGVIMGANIGTTVTAQIVALKVTRYALLFVAAGFGMLFLARQRKIQRYGSVVMGLGLIFFGMDLMSSATGPLRTYQPFIDLMRQLENPLWAILISAAFTGLVQSSSATTGIIIVLAGQGFITLEAGIALALGANLGTCVTAVLAAIGKPPEAVQAAMVHVLFNVLGILIWLGFIDQLAVLVRWISPSDTQVQGAVRLAAETPRQIANAHTVFNVTNTLIFIWLTRPLSRLVQWLVPERPVLAPRRIRPQYLDPILLRTPELALDRVRLELGRLGQHTLRMVRTALPTVMHGTEDDLETLAHMDDDVDILYAGIVTYMGQLSQENLTSEYSEELSSYIAIANHIESIGDMIETNLVEAGSGRLKYNVEISQSTEQILLVLHEQVVWAVETALEALDGSDQHLAGEVMAAKLRINRLATDAENHLAHRLTVDEPNRLHSFRIESEIIEYLKRVYYFAKRIAKLIADADMVYRQVDLKQLPDELLVEQLK